MTKLGIACVTLLVLACSGAQNAAPPAEAPSQASENAAATSGHESQPEAAPSTEAKPKSGNAVAAVTAPAAPPARERIRLHNSCSKPVPLRIERDHDSDTDTTLGSNTSTEEHATNGDEIRLLDDHHNVISAQKIEAATQEINVTSDCSKLESR